MNSICVCIHYIPTALKYHWISGPAMLKFQEMFNWPRFEICKFHNFYICMIGPTSTRFLYGTFFHKTKNRERERSSCLMSNLEYGQCIVGLAMSRFIALSGQSSLQLLLRYKCWAICTCDATEYSHSNRFHLSYKNWYNFMLYSLYFSKKKIDTLTHRPS